MDSAPTQLEKITDAHTDYILENYESAYKKFTVLIDQSKTYDYNLLIYRSFTAWKLNRTDDMLDDADRAYSLSNGRYEAAYLRSIGLFYKGKLIDSLKEIQRCKQAVAQFQSVDPRRQEVDRWAKVIDEEIIKSPTADHSLQKGNVGYEWRQTESKVYIEVIYSLQDKEDLVVKYDKERCEIFFPFSEYKSFELNLDLFGEIIPDQCKHNVLLDRIEIVMEKATKGAAWKMLEKETSKNEQVLEQEGPKKISAFPGRGKAHDPKKFKKDLESQLRGKRTHNPKGVAATVPQQQKQEPAPTTYSATSDGPKKVTAEQPIPTFAPPKYSNVQFEGDSDEEFDEDDKFTKQMKAIYNDADDETKRAMIKSLQESGGQVLDTDWSKVKENHQSGRIPQSK